MEINYIREFVTLAQTGNFSEAAETLFISQSSLSKHIHVLEKELGAPLFDRNTRKVCLNQFGELFMPYAATIVQAQYGYTSAFYNKLENIKKTITIGSIPVMAQYQITDILVRFKKDNPQFTLNVLEAESLELKEMLLNNECEMAFVREAADEAREDFVRIPYTRDNLVAVLPSSHPFAGRDSLTLEELKEEDLLLLDSSTIIYSICVQACTRSGFTPRVAFTGHRLENLMDLVTKGMGIALLMKKQAAYLAGPALSLVDIMPCVATQISLMYKKDSSLSPAARHFIRCTHYCSLRAQ